MRKVPPQAKALVKKWEGLRLNAYLCPARIPTIGYGATFMDGRPVKLGDRITKERAEQMLDIQLASVLASIYQLTPAAKVDRLTDDQLSALISFVYNVGSGTYRYGSRSNAKKKIGTGSVYAAVMAGSPQAMAMGLRKYVMANGKILPGLKQRREEEAKLVLSSGLLPAPPDVPGPSPLPLPPDTPPSAPTAPAGGWGGGLALAWGLILAIASIIGWVFFGATGGSP
jgi:lysozyme